MGASGKPDIPNHSADHARYLDAWVDALELESVVLVGQDWAAHSHWTGRRVTLNAAPRSGLHEGDHPPVVVGKVPGTGATAALRSPASPSHDKKVSK